MACVGDRIAEVAEEHPNRIAIQTDKDQITYEEFYQSSQRLKCKLIPLLTNGNKRVGLLLPNTPKWLECFMAVSLSGGIAIPFDPKWSPAQVREVIKDAQPDVVIYEERFMDRLEGVSSHILSIEELDLLTPTASEHELPSDKDPFYIGYTSGTTGQPKGFVRSHASWADCFLLGQEVFALDESDHILCPGPLVHSHFLYAAVQSLHIGATLHLSAAFHAEKVWEELQNQPITVMYIVPTMFEAINQIRYQESSPYLKTLISSGAKWAGPSKETAAQVFPNASIYEFYGASELSFISVRAVNQDSSPEGAIGTPFPQVNIQVRTEEGKPVQQGEVGQLFVKSPWIFDGYLNQPEKTADVFDGDWATVGDLAYVNEGGEIILKGRKQNMIISGGLNIYPEEVEQVIRQHPLIEEVVVTGMEDKYWGEKVIAFVTCERAEQLREEDMNAYLTRLLPKYKCPKEWIIVSEFPYTSSGKIARKKLRQSVRRG